MSAPSPNSKTARVRDILTQNPTLSIKEVLRRMGKDRPDASMVYAVRKELRDGITLPTNGQVIHGNDGDEPTAILRTDKPTHSLLTNGVPGAGKSVNVIAPVNEELNSARAKDRFDQVIYNIDTVQKLVALYGRERLMKMIDLFC